MGEKRECPQYNSSCKFHCFIDEKEILHIGSYWSYYDCKGTYREFKMNK